MNALARVAGRTAAWCLTTVALAAAGASGVAAQQGGKSGGPPPAPVVVAKVEVVDEAPRGEFTGLIQPATKALLSAEVAGRLVRLDKKQGDAVERNEVVAVLENPSLEDEYAIRQARVHETEAQLAMVRAQVERNQALFERNLVSAQVVEDLRLQMAVTEAKLRGDRVQLERLKEQLERMVIRSPIKGQVIEASLELGQWITPNQPIFEIFNYDAYEVLVGVPGRLLPDVPGAGPVEVSVPEIGASLPGEILAAVRHVSGETGNFTLRVQVANRKGLPLSGMLAKVRLPLGPPRRMLTVPRDAVVRRGERTHVVLVTDEGKAQIVPVQVGGNFGSAVIVSGEGLGAGASVVVRGNERLFPGMPVRITGGLANHASG